MLAPRVVFERSFDYVDQIRIGGVGLAGASADRWEQRDFVVGSEWVVGGDDGLIDGDVERFLEFADASVALAIVLVDVGGGGCAINASGSSSDSSRAP